MNTGNIGEMVEYKPLTSMARTLLVYRQSYLTTFVMYKIYLKQALRMLRQNKFFSTVYIAGTGLAITMVMMLALLHYFRTGDISPESHRSRMLVIRQGKILTGSNSGNGTSALSFQTIRECFYPLQTPEAVTAILPAGEQSEFIQAPGSTDIYNGLVMGTDAAFWKVFPFTFLHGQPYTDEECASGIHKAVVSESLARRVFNTSEVVGRTFLLNFEEYVVAGIVKDPPSVASYCYAEMWVPFSTRPALIRGGEWSGYVLGHMYVCMLARRAADFDAICRETEESCRRYNTTIAPRTLVLNGQPDTVFRAYLHTDTWNMPDYTLLYCQIALLLVLLLLVPALNLTGITASQMKKRMEEIGIRKAFGARNRTLLIQILYENFFLTLLGGFAGLLLSYVLIDALKEWLLARYSWEGLALTPSVDLSAGMLINPTVFGYALLFCFLLNLLSALLPAWNTLRRPITDALNDR